MPRVYRSMIRDGDRPAIGDSAKKLGVRVSNNGPRDDIPVSADGHVSPLTGGMSVAPNWRDLPAYRIPQRLNVLLMREGLPGKARGSDTFACWRLGEGSFEDGPIADELALRVDTATHGLIEPDAEMTLDEYRAAIRATAEQWVVDEE